MNHKNHTEQFVQYLTENQSQLYAYIYTLLGDHNRTADVLQETNLVLWRKIDSYDVDKPFRPWAYAIARFQVMAHMRDHRRDLLITDSRLTEMISQEAEKQVDGIKKVRELLQPCMQQLTPNNRQIVNYRYLQSMSLNEIASNLDRKVGAIKVALFRIRKQLAECVQKHQAMEG